MLQDPVIRNVIMVDARPLTPDHVSALVPSIAVRKLPSQFASALAHEVRNPLSNINLAVDILHSMMQDPEQKNYLDIILRGTAKINDLVSDLIAYYQTEELRLQKYSINKLLDEVLAKTVDKIMLKNIEVIKDYGSFDNKICVDLQKIKIALTNIIINAIDAMRSDDRKLKLITKSRKGKCTIEIKDNGIGISKENLKNIFKPYYTNKPGGMGLGLATTADILVSNHALIDVQSHEGIGTSFILSFKKVV